MDTGITTKKTTNRRALLTIWTKNKLATKSVEMKLTNYFKPINQIRNPIKLINI